MELAGAAYLYTVATLAMTFVGFCAIVLIFRQSMGAKSSRFHRYASHVYIELGFESAGLAMLAPLLAACDLPATLTWRLSSAVIVIVVAVHTWSILRRFKANRPGPFPRRVWTNTSITCLIGLALLANAAALIEPTSGPVAIIVSWRLFMGVEIFLLTLEEFLETPARSRKR